MRQNIKKQKGSIFKWVLILIALLLLLSYFGFDLESFINSETVQNNFSFLWNSISEFWNNYLAEYFNIFWNYIKPLTGPAADKISGTKNILDLLENIKIPEIKSVIPEITVPENTPTTEL